jgi:hypothetical protein
MRLALIALAFTLAACESEPQQEVAAPVEIASSSSAPTNASITEPVSPVSNTIPVQFLGVWDAEAGNCEPSSDMRLEISEDGMIFYESAGTVQTVREDEGTTMVTLAMEGEGERWTQTLGLRFFDAGTSLMVIHPEHPEEAERYIRKRCPN